MLHSALKKRRVLTLFNQLNMKHLYKLGEWILLKELCLTNIKIGDFFALQSC